MKYTYICIAILFLLLTDCRKNNQTSNSTIISFDDNRVDSISIDAFSKKYKINYFILGIDTIQPKTINWAEDSKDLYLEGFYIVDKLLKIYQPNKIDTIENYKNIRRLYIYDNKKIKTTRVLIDSLKFDFDEISIDYDSPNIFKKDNFIILINEPVGWCGTANQYRFVQVFDITKLRCFEFFINYYSILYK